MSTHEISECSSEKYIPLSTVRVFLDEEVPTEAITQHAISKCICDLEEQSVPSSVNLRKTIACNNYLVALVSGGNQEIIVLSHQKEASKCIIKGFHTVVTDFCFVSPQVNVIVSVDDSPNVWIHSIVEADGVLTESTLGNLTFPENVLLWGISAALPQLDVDESIDCGYLLVGIDEELTAVQIGSASLDSDSTDISEVPRVSFGECQNLFAVCGDGRRLAVYNDFVVSVYLLPSPAAHTSWEPHGRSKLAALSFGSVSTSVITFSNEDHSVLFWDINCIEPECIQRIQLPWQEFRLVASPKVDKFFLYGSKPSIALAVNSVIMREVKTYFIDTVDSDEPLGICSLPIDGEHCLLLHFANRITAYLVPEKRNEVHLKKSTEQEEHLHTTRKESHEQNCDISTTSSMENINQTPILLGLSENPATQKTPERDPDNFWNSSEDPCLTTEKERVCTTKTDIFQELARSVEMVTASVIQTTKALTSYQESISTLKASASLFPPRCVKVIKKCLKERADTCIVSLDSSFEKFSTDLQLPIDYKSIQVNSPNIASQLVSECMKTCEREINHLTFKTNRDSDSSFHMQIRKICRNSFSTVELNACVEEIDNLRNEVLSNQSSRNIIIGLLRSERYDEALGMTLEAHSTDMLLWLLTEACTLQTWSELVVDERLSPVNTFSLTYNTCVALSVGSTVYPANASEELILLVRDTAITYKKQWAESCDRQVYNNIRAHCCNLLQSMEKGSARGPLHSCMRETIRVIQA